jgi:osmotically-inducible protein OsmY
MDRRDEDIKKDVVDQLYWDNRVNAADVKVDVLNGQVTLTGSVPTLTARSNAIADAWMITGVKNVFDRLTVIYPSDFDLPTDAEIRENIENSLRWNVDIYSADINVLVEGGVATLKGTVDAYWKKWKAEDLASEVRGVTEVVNELAIVSTGRWLDRDIAIDIEDAMDRNPTIEGEDITVKVEDGKVILTGVVPSWYVRSQTENIANYTAGVVEVDNNLQVESLVATRS